MTEAAAPNPAGRRPGAARLLSDDRLTRRAARGDRGAFEEIYRRYQQDLYRFCLALVGSPQDAQDVLQNTMVKVLRALPGEERRIQLKPWLYRIARNESVETIRKRRPNAELEAEATPAAEGIAESVEARERLRGLIGDLGELPERQRAALVMRELAGLGFAQIGAAFDSSAAVARQTVYEARLSLRQMEAGREMTCKAVMRELSEADGRVTRRRELRAHLRGCADCRAFRESIAGRRDALASIAPLPAAASAALLNGVLGGSASTGAAGAGGAAAGGAAAAGSATGTAGSATAAGGGLAGTIGTGAGSAVATTAIVKSAVTVAVAVVVGAAAADRGGLIDTPLLGGDKAASSKRSSKPAGTPGGDGAATAQPRRGSAGQRARANRRAARKREGRGAGGDAWQGRRDAANPPGRKGSTARQRGKPDGLPAAAGQGQQTAGANKPTDPGGSAGQGSPPTRGEAPQSPPQGEEAESPPPAPAKPPAPGKAGDEAGQGAGGTGQPAEPE
ncbi:MAG: sigma-70 family RNA polymerase sigma factor [Solirubrobacterales bacterium]